MFEHMVHEYTPKDNGRRGGNGGRGGDGGIGRKMS